jgi:uncharacterized protein involved in exopolysaccharide biosynthesis
MGRGFSFGTRMNFGQDRKSGCAQSRRPTRAFVLREPDLLTILVPFDYTIGEWIIGFTQPRWLTSLRSFLMFPWLSLLKKPIRLGALAAVIVGIGLLFSNNHYQSEASILPVDSRSSGGGLSGSLSSAAAAFGVSLPGSDGPDANFSDILLSRWMKENLLLAKFKFEDKPSIFGANKAKNETLYDYLDARNLDDAVRRMGSLMTVSKDAKTKVLHINVETTSPELSQAVVKLSINLLESFVGQKGRTKGGAKALFADARLHEARDEMNQAEDDLRKFLEENRNYATSADPTVRLHGARLEAELKLRQQLVFSLAMNREQSLMEEKNDIPILNILDPGNLPIRKKGPARLLMILVTFGLVALGTLAAQNWAWVCSKLLGPESSS